MSWLVPGAIVIGIAIVVVVAIQNGRYAQGRRSDSSGGDGGGTWSDTGSGSDSCGSDGGGCD